MKALILDFQMPKKTGLDVVKEVRRMYEEKNRGREECDCLLLPVIIFMSSFISNQQFRETCSQQGVNYFFEKPLLQSRIKEIKKILWEELSE